MGGELAEGAPPGWGRIAPGAGAGCSGPSGSRGSWWCWEQTSDLVSASPSVARCVLRERSEDLGVEGIGGCRAGRAAAGGVPGHRLEAAQRHRTARIPQHCQEPRASDPARLPAPGKQALFDLSLARSSLLRRSSHRPGPLRCFARSQYSAGVRG